MTEEQRQALQKHYLACAEREGWMKDGKILWPPDDEKRAKTGRELLGLALVSGMDAVRATWSEHAGIQNADDPRLYADRIMEDLSKGFEGMTENQRCFVMKVIDSVLKSAAYHFSITLDRFEHGDISMFLTPQDAEPPFTAKIHPHGFLEMFQDILDWEERFSIRYGPHGKKASSPVLPLVKPDEALAAIVGADPLSRTEVTKRLWEYIKAKGLQDAKTKTLIHADAALKTVFNGKEQVTMFEMTKLIPEHFNELP